MSDEYSSRESLAHKLIAIVKILLRVKNNYRVNFVNET